MIDAQAPGAQAGGALVDERTLVLCVHGCNEVNVEAVQMAKRAREEKEGFNPRPNLCLYASSNEGCCLLTVAR